MIVDLQGKRSSVGIWYYFWNWRGKLKQRNEEERRQRNKNWGPVISRKFGSDLFNYLWFLLILLTTWTAEVMDFSVSGF